MLVIAALLLPGPGSFAGNTPAPPAPVKDVKDNFLSDMNFCSMVFQDISSKPIVWNDDRSLAVIYDETASGALCYTFWCVKRNAKGTMDPIAKYKIWTDFPKKGILLDEKGLTIILESSKRQQQQLGTTTISHHFPFTIPQAQISFLRNGQEYLNGVMHEDLQKEWKEFTKKWN